LHSCARLHTATAVRYKQVAFMVSMFLGGSVLGVCKRTRRAPFSRYNVAAVEGESYLVEATNVAILCAVEASRRRTTDCPRLR
jgi:hypothetical protein